MFTKFITECLWFDFIERNIYPPSRNLKQIFNSFQYM